MLGHRPVITACLCVGLSPCTVHCIAHSYLVHTLKSGLTTDHVAHGAKVSYGNIPELSGQFGPVLMVPKCLGSEVFVHRYYGISTWQ